ncbi:MAG: immunoglobulin-like domain-containing protein [Fusicatenibacter sp.]
MKKVTGLLLVIFSFLLMACGNVHGGETQGSGSDGEEETYFEGTVLEVQEKYLLVAPEKDSWVRRSADQIQVAIPENMDDITRSDIKENTKIGIWFTGGIAESYPGQIHQVLEIQVLKEDSDNPSESGIEGEKIKHAGPYGSISITVPDGWSYRLCDVEDEQLIAGEYGIQIYPDGVKTGLIEVAYESSFGVCGTGLEEEERVLAGHLANIGYYDGSNVWSFVAFRGKYKNIIAVTSMAESWLEEYSDQVMEILNTIVYDPEEQSGAIGYYEQDSENSELALMVSVVHISDKKATLRFQQYDASAADELFFGENFIIEEKKEGSWFEADHTIDRDSVYAFDDVAHIIQMGETTDYEYDWEWLYGSLEPGEYRIAVEINDQTTIYAYFVMR